MKHIFESLIKRAAEKEPFSGSERERMRVALREYARIKPIRDSGKESGVPSPYTSIFPRYFMRPAAGFMAAILVLVTGTSGIAYAAEGALPGDTLYPIKVNVTEPVRITLAADTAQKAALHRRFAETRISEAAALAKQGRLTAAVQTELETRFVENSDKGGQEIDGATKVAFDARLAAHEAVLERIDEERRGTSTLAMRTAIRGRIAVADTQESPTDARAMLFTATMKQTSPTRDEKEAEDLTTNADLALKSSSQTVDARTGTLGATTTLRAKSELERAAKLAEKGRQLLKEGDADGAYEASRESLRASTRVEIFTKAAATLKVNPFVTSSPVEATSTATTTSDSERESRIEFRGRR